MTMCFADGCGEEIAWARRAMSGAELQDENSRTTAAVLSLIPGSDWVVQRYTRPASTWATVTPVVLPGYDDPRHFRRRIERQVGAEEKRELLDRLDERIERLLRKAIVHAGYSQELADGAWLEWRQTAWWRGAETANRYGVPDHLKRFARYHVRIRWRDARGRELEIPGPICIGGGRYYGLGLFAAE